MTPAFAFKFQLGDQVRHTAGHSGMITGLGVFLFSQGIHYRVSGAREWLAEGDLELTGEPAYVRLVAAEGVTSDAEPSDGKTAA